MHIMLFSLFGTMEIRKCNVVWRISCGGLERKVERRCFFWKINHGGALMFLSNFIKHYEQLNLYMIAMSRAFLPFLCNYGNKNLKKRRTSHGESLTDNEQLKCSIPALASGGNGFS